MGPYWYRTKLFGDWFKWRKGYYLRRVFEDYKSYPALLTRRERKDEDSLTYRGEVYANMIWETHAATIRHMKVAEVFNKKPLHVSMTDSDTICCSEKQREFFSKGGNHPLSKKVEYAGLAHDLYSSGSMPAIVDSQI